MSLETLNEMSISEKANYIVENADKKMIRKVCGVSPSQFLLLQSSGKEKLRLFIEKKMDKMSREKIDSFIQEIEK